MISIREQLSKKKKNKLNSQTLEIMLTITAVWQKKGKGGEEVRPSPLPVCGAKSNKLEETSSVNLICYLALQLTQD